MKTVGYRLSALILGTGFFLSCHLAESSSNIKNSQNSSKVHNYLKPFSKAKADEIQHVIALPKLADEHNHEVEIIVGRQMQVDCNQHVLGGRIERVVLQGWGYEYYKVRYYPNRGISTLMGCPNVYKRQAFITMPSEKVKYNSRAPIVIYAPKSLIVKYKIWSGGKVESLP